MMGVGVSTTGVGAGVGVTTGTGVGVGTGDETTRDCRIVLTYSMQVSYHAVDVEAQNCALGLKGLTDLI